MSIDVYITVNRGGELFDALFLHNAFEICAWFENNLKSVSAGTGYVDENGYDCYPITRQEYEQFLSVCRSTLASQNRPGIASTGLQPDAQRKDMGEYWESIASAVEQLEMAKTEIDWNSDLVSFTASY